MQTETKKTFLGLVYIVNELLKAGVFQYDPENRDNMLIYRQAGKNSPEGWYSENIMSAVSELFQDKDQMEYVLSVAKDSGIDTEKLFRDAYELIHN